MAQPTTSKGASTRAHILQAALAAFRERGFANTTMRDIANEAGMSLGAAYHYFESKEAIVAAYYGWMQEEHERKWASHAPRGGVSTRLRVLLNTKLELLRGDRKILVALLAAMADPDNPLSLFGPATSDVRERSLAMFRKIFEDTGLSEELEQLAAYGAWLTHLAVMLYFVHDRSKEQRRTHALVDGAAEFFGSTASVAAMPPFRGLLRKVAVVGRKLGVPA